MYFRFLASRGRKHQAGFRGTTTNTNDVDHDVLSGPLLISEDVWCGAERNLVISEVGAGQLERCSIDDRCHPNVSMLNLSPRTGRAQDFNEIVRFYSDREGESVLSVHGIGLKPSSHHRLE